MKKVGITLIFIYVLLTLGLFSVQTREFAVMGIIILLPVLMIIASTSLIKDGLEYPNRKLLVICSTLALILFVAAGFFIDRIPSLWDYYNPTFYVATGLLIIAVGISVNNAFAGKLTPRGSVDIIILIFPITAFFIFEVYQYNRFTDVRDIERVDYLTNEIVSTNSMIIDELIPEGESIKYMETIELMEEVFYSAAEWSGGFREGYMATRLHAPNNSLPTEKVQEWVQKIRNSLQNDIENEWNEAPKSELNKIRNELFGQQSIDNSVLEIRLRIYIAQNRLLTLNLIE